MATKRLSDILDEDESGQLRSRGATTTPAATVAGALGLPAAPATPLGTSGLPGATPDQAKMSGVPAQLASTLGATGVTKTSAPRPDAAPRVDASGMASNAGPKPSEVEARRVEERNRLKAAYGDVGLKVADLIASAIPAGPVASPKFSVGDLGSILDGVSPHQATNVQNALQSLAERPGDANAYAAAQRALADVGRPGDPKQYLQQADVGDAVANAAGRLQLTPQTLERLGIQSGELELLGIDPVEAEGMTVAQLQDRIDAALAEETDRLEQLRRDATDPTTPPNVRAAAREELARAGGTGLAASAAGADDLRDEIADGGRIRIAGRELSVEEFLDDAELPGLVRQFLESPETRAELTEQLGPEFAKFVDSHREFFEAATKELDFGASSAKSVQEANAGVMSALAASGVDANAATKLFQQLFPEMGDEFSVSKIDPSESGLLSVLLDPAKSGAELPPAEIASRFSSIADVDADLASELAKLSPAELARTGFLAKSGTKFDTYISAIRERKAFDADPTGTIRKIFEKHGGAANVWNDAMGLAAAGDDRARKLLGPILDRDGDGKLDSESKIIDAARNYAIVPDVQSLAEGRKGQSLSRLIDRYSVSEGGTLASKLAPHLADGGLTSKDISALYDTLSIDEFRKLADSPLLSGSGKKSVAEAIESRVRNDTVSRAREAWKSAGIGDRRFVEALKSGEVPQFAADEKRAVAQFATFLEGLASRIGKDGDADYLRDLAKAARAESERAEIIVETGRVDTKPSAAKAKKPEEKLGDWLNEFNKDPLGKLATLPVDILTAVPGAVEQVVDTLLAVPGGYEKLNEAIQKNPGFANLAAGGPIAQKLAAAEKVSEGAKDLIDKASKWKPPKLG